MNSTIPQKNPLQHDLAITMSPRRIKRFWKRIAKGKSDVCWPWLGALTSMGYGNLGIAGKNKMAHRVAYELTHGSIPDGLVICHRCDNPRCCNPDHLFLGTYSDNVQDMMAKGRGNVPGISKQVGSENGHAKLQEPQVQEIRRLYATGNYTHRELAQLFGIGHTTIDNILVRRSWKHVL